MAYAVTKAAVALSRCRITIFVYNYKREVLVELLPEVCWRWPAAGEVFQTEIDEREQQR